MTRWGRSASATGAGSADGLETYQSNSTRTSRSTFSASRRDFPWNNTFRVEGDLREAVTQLKEKTPQGVLVGSPTLSAALERLGLIDEYRLVVHPVIAGHGPTLFQGLEPSRRLELVSTNRLKSGQVALHYRRKEG